MYVVDVLRVLIRRWYVLIVGILVMAGAGFVVIDKVPTNYQASATLVFLLPADTPTTAPMNPYLNFQSGQGIAASLVGSMLSTNETQRDMVKSGFRSEYAVAQPPESNAPQLSITAQDSDPQMVVATVREVIRRIGERLADMQTAAGAPRAQLIKATPFNVTNVAEPLHGDKIRALAVVGGLVGLLTLMAAFFTDRVLRGRGRKGAVSRSDEKEDAVGTTNDGPTGSSASLREALDEALPRASEADEPVGLPSGKR